MNTENVYLKAKKDILAIQDLIQELKDILIEVEDIGYDTFVIYTASPYINAKYIKVEISNVKIGFGYAPINGVKIKNFHTQSDLVVEEVILRCQDFMKNYTYEVLTYTHSIVLKFSV